ncbi:MAG TPA: OB-fold domain-containing protein [Thermoleophilaceae bacterium]|nr:OB-fold domain-containing protein [Thermoleophilaceae bacterium]
MTSATASRHLVPGLYEVGPEGPRLIASRCETCESYAFPPRTVCSRCKSRTMVPARVGERGTLFSFTVCHAAPSGWRAPYLQAYVSPPEGIRVFSLVSDEVPARLDALQVGMEMELVIEPVRPGGEVLTYKYRPVDQHA